MRKKFMSICITILISMNMTAAAFASASPDTGSSQTAIIPGVQPRKADIRYQYKTINKVLHKRLYNFTTRKPVTSWEAVS